MSARRDARPRAWQRMLSGRRLDLLDPSPLDVEIEDIAHGLARVARWNGQTCGPLIFSVAQHSLFVERLLVALDPLAPPRARLAALLHDAPEYVIGDIISPFKAAIGEAYTSVEARILAAIHQRFSLPAATPPTLARLVKKADRAAAFHEATRLAGFDVAEAQRAFGRPEATLPDLEAALSPRSAERVELDFLSTFAALREASAA